MNNLERIFLTEAAKSEIEDDPNYYKGKLYTYIPDLWRAQDTECDKRDQEEYDWWWYQYNNGLIPDKNMECEMNYCWKQYDEYWDDLYSEMTEDEIWWDRYYDEADYAEYLDDCYDYACDEISDFIKAIDYWANYGFKGFIDETLTLDDVTEEIAAYQELKELGWKSMRFDFEPEYDKPLKKDRSRADRRKKTAHAKNHHRRILEKYWNVDPENLRQAKYGYRISEVNGKRDEYYGNKGRESRRKLRHMSEVSMKGAGYKRPGKCKKLY